MEYADILKTIEQEIKQQKLTGKVANYIPELAKVDPNAFGMHVLCNDGSHFGFGEQHTPFSIQSISKVFMLTLAFKYLEEQEIFKRVGVEPSGDPFNSLIQLEQEKGIPRNPFINAGALVICDILLEVCGNPQAELVKMIQRMADIDKVPINQDVFDSEMKCSQRNQALINFMKSFGNIKHEINEVLTLYTHFCAIELTCAELAGSFTVYAKNGKLSDGTQLITASQTKRINALMQTCGFYDEAGEFSYRIGLPGKSGVGGGIAAVHPNELSVTVWSPPLNKKGNSELGMYALERFTTLSGVSVF
ncbi:glutaminase [Aquimarina sp. ERC-38]|uniref:glutaminase n=1 Tax=Aquimarina sp. ERC-38 TaxID=2949996 RepID=UPI0022477161|nr:glutaminase [Aquimarina sp. ERC-38]UZO80801.1 glutaminase [Aquimarina sp. ERC-38]